MQVAANTRGPALWHLPGNFRRDEDRLADTLEHLPAGRHAFEFRHESWFTRDVYDILRAYGAAEMVERRQAKFEAMGAWREEPVDQPVHGEVPAGA